MEDNRTVAMMRRDATGEGSRGGVVIGRTSTGKPIYMNHSHPGHANFSKDDHKDAARVHHRRERLFKGKRREQTSTENKNSIPIHNAEGTKHLNSSLHKKVPGSTKGSVIGHIKSGKAVKAGFSKKESKNFTKREHDEAGKIHIKFAKDFPNHATNIGGKDSETAKQIRHHDLMHR